MTIFDADMAFDPADRDAVVTAGSTTEPLIAPDPAGEWPRSKDIHTALSSAGERLATLHCFQPIIQWMERYGNPYNPGNSDWDDITPTLHQLIRDLRNSGVPISIMSNEELVRLHELDGTVPAGSWERTHRDGRIDTVVDPFYLHQRDPRATIIIPPPEEYRELSRLLVEVDHNFGTSPQFYVQHLLHEISARVWFTMMKIDKHNRGDSPLSCLTGAALSVIEGAVIEASDDYEAAALHTGDVRPKIRSSTGETTLSLLQRTLRGRRRSSRAT